MWIALLGWLWVTYRWQWTVSDISCPPLTFSKVPQEWAIKRSSQADALLPGIICVHTPADTAISKGICDTTGKQVLTFASPKLLYVGVGVQKGLKMSSIIIVREMSLSKAWTSWMILLTNTNSYHTIYPSKAGMTIAAHRIAPSSNFIYL